MLTRKPYEQLVSEFDWALPERLNMAAQACDDWAAHAPERPAIIDLTQGMQTVSYAQLQRLSWRVQATLYDRGLVPGDRVGVLLSQGPLCAAAHIAIWRAGAISVPLFKLFKRDALTSRVSLARIDQVVTDDEGRQMLEGLPVVCMCEHDLPAAASVQPNHETRSEDPAVIIFTSGTTGAPKGALHAHQVLTGHLPGVEISHDFLGQPGDCLWTPADWAWIGGLFDVLMPGLALGVPVVAARMAKFSTEDCIKICQQAAVKNVFFPPTALRMLKADDVAISGLRSVASGGEPLGAEMLDWGRRAFGLTINEFYGQTECNMVASSCSTLFDPTPGAIGKAVPGHRVSVIDATGSETSDEGDIAIARGSASMMLEYWDNPQETHTKFRGDWMLTGDRGRLEDNTLVFVGREDDVITSAGYRIGPAEIEDCLLTHPAVATVGVVGKPDQLRTQIVKAYVVTKPDARVDVSDLQNWVKERLATYLYPREIQFLDALPMTVTGKVIRKELRARAAAEAVV
jgi:acetyl-CoA synthetase